MPRCRAAVFDGQRPRHLDVRDFDLPELGPDGELVIRTLYCGVCGSDLHRFSWSKERPIILGHEILGVVERAPDHWRSAAGEPFAPGDLVVPETRIPCHRCEYCRGVGSRPQKLLDYSHCPNQRGLGGIPLDVKPFLSGGWSDFVELPDGAIVHKIDPHMQPEIAVLLEPFSIGMKANHLAGLTVDDTVVILGPGPIGLLAVVAAKEAGARRIILAGTAADEQRLALGRDLGADQTIDVRAGDPVEQTRALNRGRLATRVIEATGTALAIELGVSLLAPGGVLVTVGGQRADARVSINPSDLVARQLDIRGTQLGANHYESCIAVLAAGKYPFERLVTHRFGLSAVEEALLTFEARGNCIKPIIAFG
jgi:threonine dehydrogenase-like Zn-dependent dehydrogenase